MAVPPVFLEGFCSGPCLTSSLVLTMKRSLQWQHHSHNFSSVCSYFFSVGWKFPFRSLLCWWLCSIKQIKWNTHLNDTSQSWFCVCSVWPKDHRDIHLPHAGLREKVWVSIRWEIFYVAWNWKFYFLCIADSQSQATFVINAETCEPGSAATLVHSFGS